MRHKLIVLTGPTGVGKTATSLFIAEKIGTPIINADSRQMFNEIPIGTSAPTPEQLARVKHYFVGTLSLTDYYSAARFETDVTELLTQLYTKNKCVLLTGGSMMYINAVVNGIDDIPSIDNEVRCTLSERFRSEGLPKLLEELRLMDPTYYDVVDRRNHKRIIHALEICYTTGKPYSSFLSGKKKQRPYDILKIAIELPREELYERINKRVDQMMISGLLDEAIRVSKYRYTNALNTVGYKELFLYLDGTWSLETATEKIKQNTRIYARKQMTWIRRDSDILHFHPKQTDEIMHTINKFIADDNS